MYATRSRKVKTDRRDAHALAEACLLGAYRPAHRLSDPQRHVRGRLGVRDALVHTRTRYISLVRALLRQHGYRVPSDSAEGFIQRVRALPLPGRLLSVGPESHPRPALAAWSAPIQSLAPNVLARQFAVPAPDTAWVTDITEGPEQDCGRASYGRQATAVEDLAT